MFFHQNFLNRLSRLTLAFVLLTSLACAKKEPQPPPQPTATPLPQTSIPVTQLLGLTLNGIPVEKVAGQVAPPDVLGAEDIIKAFGIKNYNYLQRVLTLIQGQVQTGSPLNLVSVYFGTVPKKLASQCLEDIGANFCLIPPFAFNCSEAIPQKNWSDGNYAMLCQRLGRLKAYNPSRLVALFDGDNTMWYQDVSNAGVKKGVDSKKIFWEEARAELLSIFPPPEERIAYRATKTPYDYYQQLYKAVGPLWNYNYAALAFRGLSLKEAYEINQEMMQEPYAPIAFPEMTDLLKYLNDQGILAAVVSASPIFGVLSTVEALEPGLPLDRATGLDVYMKNPKDPGSLPVLLSRLIDQGTLNPTTGQAEKFKNYQEVLQTYGDWVIVDVDQVITARGGKGVAGRSLARRYVAEHNRNAISPQDKINIDDLRLVMVGGDNFAAPTDIQSLEGDRVKSALEGGNDQGMAESLPFLETGANVPGGTDLLLIRRYALNPGNQVNPKKGKLENFEAFTQQQQLLRPGRIGAVLIQGAVTDVEAPEGKGGFLKETPAAETQPSLSPGSAAPVSPPPPGGIPSAQPGVPTSPSPLTAPQPVMPQAVPVTTPAAPAQPGAPALPPSSPIPGGEGTQLAPLPPQPPAPPAPPPAPQAPPPETDALP